MTIVFSKKEFTFVVGKLGNKSVTMMNNVNVGLYKERKLARFKFDFKIKKKQNESQKRNIV